MNYTLAWLLLLQSNTRNTFPQQEILNQFLIISSSFLNKKILSLNVTTLKTPGPQCTVHSCMTKSISTWFSLQTWIFPNIFSCPQHSALVVAVLTMSLILLFCPLLTPCDFQYLRPLLKQLLMRARSWVLTVDITAPSPVTNKRRGDPGSKLNRPLICEATFQSQVIFWKHQQCVFYPCFSDVFAGLTCDWPGERIYISRSNLRLRWRSIMM